jgi:hypothetical protein
MKRKASIDPYILAQVMSNLFDASGKPSPTLKKVITHFKDRFREAAALLVTELGGATLGKPSSKNETTKDGSRIFLSVKLENPASSLRDLGPIKLERVRNRMLTPTMKSAGFELRTNQVLNDRWGDVLRDREDGLVMVYVAPSGNGIVLQAALLFHHPSDDANEAAEAEKGAPLTPLPSGEIRLLKDGLLTLNGKEMILQESTRFFLTPREQGQRRTRITFPSNDDPRGWELIQDAEVPARARYLHLLNKADALGVGVGKEEYALDGLLGDEHILRANIHSMIKSLARDLLTSAGAASIQGDSSSWSGEVADLGSQTSSQLDISLRWGVPNPSNLFGEWVITLHHGKETIKRSGRGEPSGSSVYDLYNLGSLQKYFQVCLEEPMTADLAGILRQARQS